MPTTDDRKEHFAKKRLTFILVAFIVGVLCSTHPRKYFQEAGYGPQPKDDKKDKSKDKGKKRPRRPARPEEELWSPPQQVRFKQVTQPRTSRMPRRRYSDSDTGLPRHRPGRHDPMDFYQDQDQ
ncbi:hypothetical protein KVT40_001108 [Elsinoe batatas]|uniref:Uncharacterized protein n=1 Tax=Elsinoe batatas TaxID=2601811 RepID=A0A8K0LC81_9PEZI|nr:hypothetical protein KVT40_001108 [Elsinoe batatas]